MTLLADNARRILHRALQAQVGIRVHVAPTGEMMAPTWRAKQTLYRFKQEDVDFKNLQIEFDGRDPDNYLVIVKRTPGDTDAQDK